MLADSDVVEHRSSPVLASVTDQVSIMVYLSYKRSMTNISNFQVNKKETRFFK